MSFCFNDHKMKVITIQQPYANLVINGVKNIENRSRNIKIDKNQCKNWLLVHSSSKPMSKSRRLSLQKRYNIESNLSEYIEPTSAIIGMIHIHSVKKKSILENSKWAVGPYCWYIDAVIKYKNPIKTVGKMGQGITWNPDIKIYKNIEDEINISMYDISQIDDIEFHSDFGYEGELIYYVTQRGEYMTWEDVIKSLKDDIDTFKYKFIRVLLSIKYKAYFWECDKVILKEPFRFAIFESKTLSERKQDDDAFKGKINCSKNVISFPSLSKHILLVVPCSKSHYADYTSLATFSRSASIKQQIAFWKKIGAIIKEGDWVSTSGLGVSWLHVRISNSPKYYHSTFLHLDNYRSQSRLIIDKYIENFKFPSKFTNMIIISKTWKSDSQLDLINYYFGLAPKNTLLVFGKNKILKEKAGQFKLKTKEFNIDWKKYGRFGASKTNEEILYKEKPHLITFFGDDENNVSSTVDKLIIK